MSGAIFVFGSNLGGRHGAGAALTARLRYGAVYGQGIGRTGNAYAIPTKDRYLRTLPIGRIGEFIEEFVHYAKGYPQLEFNVTRVGCGRAGFGDTDIAPFFELARCNVHLPGEWAALLPNRSGPWLPMGWMG